MPSIILRWNVPMVPTRRNVAMARRNLSASDGVNPAATIAIRIACSWNSGTPSALRSTASSSFEGERTGMEDGGVDGSGPEDGDLDDEIVEILRLEPRQHAHLCAALDLEHADRIRALEHAVDRRILRRNAREREFLAVMPLDQGERL